MADNDVVIRVRVADQTVAGFRGIDGRLRDSKGKFISEGRAMGDGLSSGIGRGADAAAASLMGLSRSGIAIPVLLGLAAAAQTLVGALALVPAAVGAAGAIAGALGIGMSGVSDALTATSSSAGSAGRAVADMSRQIRDANRAIEDAQRGVEDANRRLEDAHRGVADAAGRVEDAHRNVDSALRSLADAQRNVEDAERSLARAERDEEQALRDIDQARKDAVRTLQDLAEAQDDSVRNVEGAELALKRALENQNKVMRDHRATNLDRAEAAFRVKEAEDRLSDSQREATDATDKLTDAQEKGVEGSDEVTAAKERAAQAHEQTTEAARRLADAERGVEDARRGVADAERGVEEAQRGVADAQRAVEDAERGVADAHRAVSDAQQRLADVLEDQRKAAAGAAGGLDAYREALAKLSPEARQFVEAIVALRDEWDAMTRSVQDELFEGLAEDVTALAGEYIPLLQTGLGGIAGELNDIARYSLAELLDPSVVDAVNTVLANTARFLDEGETALGDFIAGFIELAAIGSEYLPPLGEWLALIAAQFREWVETDPEGVREFIDQALHGLADLWAIGENIVGILYAIGEGLASGGGEGQTFLGMIRDLTTSVLEFAQSDGTQMFLGFIGQLLAFLISVGPYIVPLLAGYKAWTVAQGLLNVVMAANPISLIILAIAALVAAFMWAWNNIDGFKEFWIGVWDAIVVAFNWAKDGIAAGWNWLVTTVTDAATWIGDRLSGMWDGIVGGAKVAINGAIGILNGLISGVNLVIRGLNAVNPFGQIGYVGYIGYLAKGGIASGVNMVGENGPELVDLPAGSRVHTAGDTQRMLAAQAAAAGDGGSGVLELRVAPGSDGALATVIMQLVRAGKIQLVRTGGR